MALQIYCSSMCTLNGSPLCAPWFKAHRLQEHCWWWLVPSSCSKQARCSHCTHTKMWAHFNNPEKTAHLEILLNYGWYLGQDALKAGRCGWRPRQTWACWRPHDSVSHFHCEEAQWLPDRINSVSFHWHSGRFSAGKFLVSSVTVFIDWAEKSNPVKDNEAKNNWLRVMPMSCESLL